MTDKIVSIKKLFKSLHVKKGELMEVLEVTAKDRSLEDPDLLLYEEGFTALVARYLSEKMGITLEEALDIVKAHSIDYRSRKSIVKLSDDGFMTVKLRVRELAGHLEEIMDSAKYEPPVEKTDAEGPDTGDDEEETGPPDPDAKGREPEQGEQDAEV